MDITVLLFTIFFVFYSILEITGAQPQEIRSAGLTLPALFSKYYGHEEVDFVRYHMKRTTASIIIHCAFPLLYTLGLQLVYPQSNVFVPWEAPPTIKRLLVLSLVIMLLGVTVGVVFSRNDWKRHPLAKILTKYGHDWRAMASLINAEFRDIDKFISVTGTKKVVITDTWIIYCGVHTIKIARQSDASLNIDSSDEHRLEAEGTQTQFLTVKISSSGPHITTFKVRLKAHDYSSLREKLTSPIRVARQVVIHQSLSDRFLQAFDEQVTANGLYRLPVGSPPLEPCLGCSQKMPEVKLQKTCGSEQEGECRTCECRPMWCLSCMGKWFASRQDQTRPNTWMASTATCPLCRQRFCMLDILRIE